MSSSSEGGGTPTGRHGHRVSRKGRSSTSKVKIYDSAAYDAVPNTGIRLLQLLAGDPDNSKVDGVLVVFGSGNDQIIPPYEALSWTWGSGYASEYISLRKQNRLLRKMIRPTLFDALRSLRYPDIDRWLWIDTICIDQDNFAEKNDQVQRMSEIYGQARRVVVWLGAPTPDSKLAFRFISDQLAQLHGFDNLCNDPKSGPKWLAFLNLMQLPWFSRRWVVQEVALASRAVLLCGQDELRWKDFVAAVQLFVHVETTTHRLSELMRRDPAYNHLPGRFEHVLALGATVLVNATCRLFRTRDTNTGRLSPAVQGLHSAVEPAYRSVSGPSSEEDSEGPFPVGGSFFHQASARRATTAHMIRPLHGKALLSLEYLVASLSVFDTTNPHDTVYAFLSLAADARPISSTRTRLFADRWSGRVVEAFESLGCGHRKPYLIDYESDYVEACRYFVEFCVGQSLLLDPTRALDVLCRPWAMDDVALGERRTFQISMLRQKIEDQARRDDREFLRRRQEGLPLHDLATGLNLRVTMYQRKLEVLQEALSLPSWIPQLSGATYNMDFEPGIDGLKMIRMNADSLAGLPFPSPAVYTASAGMKVITKKPRFRMRRRTPSYAEHYSMFVSGYVLDTIEKVGQTSQKGAIPREWAELSGWINPATERCPSNFWRTLVANRDANGANPPTYYGRACQECFERGGLRSGAIDTAGIINHGGNSILADFCRRVQSVIWNKALARTRSGKLALVRKDVSPGDRVCILPGCSVPVILSQVPKTSEQIEAEIDAELAYQANKIQDVWKQSKEARLARRPARNIKQLDQPVTSDHPSRLLLTPQHAHDLMQELRQRVKHGQSGGLELDMTSYWRFHGEAYVSGLMEGEACEWRAYPHDVPALQTLELR